MRFLFFIRTYFLGALAVLLFVWAGSALLFPECSPPRLSEPVAGSHGYRLWTSTTIKSFVHNGRPVCVTDGWEPIGAIYVGKGWAKYEAGKTGALIRSDAFFSKELSFKESSYRVTLRYPTTTPTEHLAAYEDLTRRAFERVGALYLKTKNASHTVVVTAGISFSDSESGSIYPDPGSNVSYLILSPKQDRFEELFMHAVMHLYNRYGGARMEYQTKQTRVAADDFQEMEASWSESAFIESDTERKARVEYLYRIHRAVRTRDFSNLHESPFNDLALDAEIQGRMAVSHGTYLDYQYAHYVLGPLIMDAIEGALQKYGTGKSVAGLLAKAHGEDADFFALVQDSIPEKEYARIIAWLENTETIDRDLINRGLAYYDRQYP